MRTEGMMRLIDADEIHDLTKVFSDKENGNAHFIYGIETAVEFADGLPTVDAAPVVHGHWIVTVNPRWKGRSHDKCSEFGWWNTRNAVCRGINEKHSHSLNFCPNYGAEMDGGND